jgi:hypothetical protein
MSEIVTFQVPFESLVEAVRSLSIEDKQKLLSTLRDRSSEAKDSLGDSEALAKEELGRE